MDLPSLAIRETGVPVTYEPIDWDNWGAPEHQGEHPDYGDCDRCGHAREWWDGMSFPACLWCLEANDWPTPA